MTEIPSASTHRPLVDSRHRSFSSLVHVDVSALTHTGHHRENNEDQFFVAKVTRALETVMTSLPPGEVPDHAAELNYLMVVADGMGGHAAGEVASRMTISALVALALEIPDWILRVDAGQAPEIERRARAQGMTMTAFLQQLLEREVALPPVDDVFARVESHEPVDLGRPAAEFVHEGRAQRTK